MLVDLIVSKVSRYVYVETYLNTGRTESRVGQLVDYNDLRDSGSSGRYSQNLCCRGELVSHVVNAVHLGCRPMALESSPLTEHTKAYFNFGNSKFIFTIRRDDQKPCLFNETFRPNDSKQFVAFDSSVRHRL